MADTGRRNPLRNQTFHSLPSHFVLVAAPPKCSQPYLADLRVEGPHCRAIHWHAKIPNMTCNHGAQIGTLSRDWIMQTLPKISLHFLQLRLQLLASCLSKHRELSATGLATDMGKTQKAESLRFALTTR